MNRSCFFILLLLFLSSCGKPDKVHNEEEEIVLRPEPTFYMDHEYVDLGLPSGLMWAACNVGAENPGEPGDFYAWGEVETKDNYDWTTYRYCEGSPMSLTKYCQDSSFGTADYKRALEAEDDVASVKWGGTWHIPSHLEFAELRMNCSMVWYYKDGHNCLLVTGPNGNQIYLPAAGYRLQTYELYPEEVYYLWSSTLYSGESNMAYQSTGNYSKQGWYYSFRCCGLPVRPVCLPQ